MTVEATGPVVAVPGPAALRTPADTDRSATGGRLGVLAAVAVVVGSGVGGALAGSRPTGTTLADPILTGVLAAVLAAAGSLAGRRSLLAAAGAAVAMSRAWLLLPSATALALAVARTGAGRHRRLAGTVAAALVAQTLLRWPPAWFLGLPSVVAAIVAAVLLGSAVRALDRRACRWALAVAAGLVVLSAGLATAVGVSLLSARASLEAGMGQARTAVRDMESGRSGAAVGDLRTAAAQLTRAYGRLDSWWAAGGALVPVAAEQRRAALAVTGAGRALVAAATQAASSLQVRSLDAGHGTFDMAAIRSIAGPVGSLAGAVDRADRAVVANSSQWLVGPVAQRMGQLRIELDRASRTAAMVRSAVDDAPYLLGGSGPRRYFVAFMTPAEDRGLGGFIGAYAVITLDHGKVTLSGSGRAPVLAPPAGSEAVIAGPAQYLDRYSAFLPQEHFEDVSYSPDFPTVEGVISELYPQMQGGQAIDGVLLLDPEALQALLGLTGPVTVPGLSQPIDGSNAADVLLRQQYLGDTSEQTSDGRHDVLQEALSTGFQKFLSNGLPSPTALTSALDPLAREGRLSFWSPDPSVQRLARQAGIAGAFPQPGRSSDVLAVTLANRDNNKIDAYLHEAVDDNVSYNPASGSVEAQVSVTLHNDAPAAGLPDYVIGSYPGSGIPEGAAEEWLTLYTPFHVSTADIGGQPFPMSGPLPELGVTAYSGYVTVPAGATVTLHVDLQGRLPAGPAYRMALRMQPLANPVNARVVVTGPQGTPAVWIPTSDEVQYRSWSFGRPGRA